MNIQDLETMATRGFKIEEGGSDRDEIMTIVEIKNKAQELYDEVKQTDGERWDKDVIAKKAASLIWFSARLAGMYGINLEAAIRSRAEETNRQSMGITVVNKLAAKPEMPAADGIGKKNETTIQRPPRKPIILSKACKPRRRRRA